MANEPQGVTQADIDAARAKLRSPPNLTTADCKPASPLTANLSRNAVIAISCYEQGLDYERFWFCHDMERAKSSKQRLHILRWHRPRFALFKRMIAKELAS